jgi:hypothetical protein
MLVNSFYEVRRTLVPKPDKDLAMKEIESPISLISINAKNFNENILAHP